MKNETEVSRKYRLAVVEVADPDTDGRVRKVSLRYQNVDAGQYPAKGYPSKMTDRAVHGLVVIHPVDWSQAEVENEVRASQK